MQYLLKTEPSEYSFAQLQKDEATVWDGVTNPVAVKNLRAMKPGDDLIIYHTGDERRTVGTASVVSVDAADPKKPVVKIKAGRELATPTSLAEIKSNPAFHDSPLLRQGRLSVVPLTEKQYQVLTRN
jgi:predicted RNA-binding protein with PUA-like domain